VLALFSLMIPLDQALAALGLAGRIEILPVSSGYPSPRYVNLVLRRHAGSAYLFETSAARPDIVAEVEAGLAARGVTRLDALLVTHCHGDHGGSAGHLAGYGRDDGTRAPIYLHSAGYRFLTQPGPTFLQETYEIFLARAHWGLIDYSTLTPELMLAHPIRKQYEDYFARTPKSALRFVDHGQLPDGIDAVYTPGHSHDCVLYFDREHGVAIPGDTIICTGTPGDPATHGYVIPIFMVAGQVYSMAYERYLRTISVLRRFFATRAVRAVLPPHGRFAVTEPLAWVAFATAYFEGIYRAFREQFLPAHPGPFRARDLNPFIPTAGTHPISTPSHVGGMLCLLADEGWLDMTEDPRTRQLTFTVRAQPPADYVTRLIEADPGELPIHRASAATAMA
jgi:glyoxylase-like metal-dependent hydrolase (beta-lactamase superfamily II)